MLNQVKSEDHVVDVLYKLALIALIPLVAVFFYLRTDAAIDRLIKGGMFCSFKRVTGLNCPGCGGTRAAFYLARFKFLESFKMNASVLVSAFLYMLFIVWESLSRLLKIKGPKEKHIYVMIGIFVVTVIVRFIVSNILIISGSL